MLRTTRIPARTADISTLLLVCGPTTGSLMLSYFAWGKKTLNPARPRISDPSAQVGIFVESKGNSGTDSALEKSTKKSHARAPWQHSSCDVLVCVHASDQWSSVCTCVRVPLANHSSSLSDVAMWVHAGDHCVSSCVPK